jgi:hypothetical protein
MNNLENTKLCPDPVAEWERLLTELIGFEFPLPQGEKVAPACLFLAVAKYDLLDTELEAYNNTHTVLTPIVIQSAGDMAEFKTWLFERSMELGPSEELALNVRITIVLKNGEVRPHEVSILDGSAVLKNGPFDGDFLKQYNTLKTQNSYHFYPKKFVTSPYYYKYDNKFPALDEKWLEYRARGGGYIRISRNVKGDIIKV